MTIPDRYPTDPDQEGSELYQFSDDPLPPAPPRPPVAVPEEPPSDFDSREGALELEDVPPPPRRRRRRRAKSPAEVDAQPLEEPIKPPRDILEREDLPPPRPFWVVPAILSAVGFALCLVPIVILASKEGTAVGLGLVALTLVGVAVQVAAVSIFLTVIGTLFGIDYGPAIEAVVKLAAVVLVVDGMTGVTLLWNPCALVLGALVGAAVFQYLFRLSAFEMIVSVAGMVGAAWILNAAVVAILAQKA